MDLTRCMRYNVSDDAPLEDSRVTAANRKKKLRSRELRVVFETSVLYTGSEAYLMRQEASDLIREHSKHSDVVIKWYITAVVRHERQFQMQSRALQLLPAIHKLERVLGHQLNITESIIKQRVNDNVETQIADLGLEVLEVDQAKVDWTKIMLDSCYRQPPFSDGKGEKGFRDAMIAEAFIDLVKKSPTTPGVCLVAFASEDTLLADSVRARTTGASNVRVLESLEGLKGLINTLVEKVTEDFVATYQPKAKNLFFEEDEKDSLFYRLNIQRDISGGFSEVLQSIPPGADERRNGTWLISAPRFIKKKGQRVFWATRIAVAAKAYKSVAPPISLGTYTSSWQFPVSGTDLGTTPSFPDYLSPTPGTAIPNTSGWYTGIIDPSQYDAAGLHGWMKPHLGDTSTFAYTKQLVRSGQSVFEVIWSVVVTSAGKLINPKIESIEYVETNWQQET